MDEILINSFSSSTLSESTSSPVLGEVNIQSGNILDSPDLLLEESLGEVNLSLDSNSAVLSVSLENESQADIYESLLVEDELSSGQSFFLNSSIDEILIPGNVSPVIANLDIEDSLISSVSSYDEIVELEEEKGKLNDIAELDKIDVAEISLNADQIYFVPLYSPESTESDHHKFVYDLDDWSIVNVMRDGAIVSEELINSFQIEMNIPSLSSYSDDKLYIEAKVVDKEIFHL